MWNSDRFIMDCDMESCSVFYIHLISYKKVKLICQVHVVFAILLVIEVTKAYHDKIKEKNSYMYIQR